MQREIYEYWQVILIEAFQMTASYVAFNLFSHESIYDLETSKLFLPYMLHSSGQVKIFITYA